MPHDALKISFGIDPFLFTIIGVPAMLFCAWKIYRDMTAIPRRWIAAYAACLAAVLFIILTSSFGAADFTETIHVSLGVLFADFTIPIFFFMLCYCGIHTFRSICKKPHHISIGFTGVFVVLLYVGFQGVNWDRTWVPPPA